MKLTMMLAAWSPLMGTLIWATIRHVPNEDIPVWVPIGLFTWAVIGTAIYTHL